MTDDSDRTFRERVQEIRDERKESAYLENADINCKPQNEYVSEETVSKIDDILDAGEKVHFLAKGNGNEVKIGSSRIRKKRKMATKGHVRTAATDRRVVCKLPNLIQDEDISVPYHNIRDIDYKSGLMNSYLIIHTDTKTYKFDVGNLHKDKVKDMAKFVQNKTTEAQYSTNYQSKSSEDPLDKLERLQDLKNEGVISEEEFAEKKESLLDQI